jgi:hypothetical protein
MRFPARGSRSSSSRTGISPKICAWPTKLKNAECLPPEVELRKDIEKTEDLLAAMPETAEKYQALKKLNFLILKLNAMRSSSIVNEIPQHYASKVVSRIEMGKQRK